MTERSKFHNANVANVADHLRRLGHTVVVHSRTTNRHELGDLEVDGKIVAALVAHARLAHHQTKNDGKCYNYEYKFATWNLHVRQVVRRRVDLWVFVLVDGRRTRHFVISHGDLYCEGHTGPTLRVQADRLGGGGHWLAKYEDAWPQAERKLKGAA